MMTQSLRCSWQTCRVTGCYVNTHPTAQGICDSCKAHGMYCPVLPMRTRRLQGTCAQDCRVLCRPSPCGRQVQWSPMESSGLIFHREEICLPDTVVSSLAHRTLAAFGKLGSSLVRIGSTWLTPAMGFAFIASNIHHNMTCTQLMQSR